MVKVLPLHQHQMDLILLVTIGLLVVAAHQFMVLIHLPMVELVVMDLEQLLGLEQEMLEEITLVPHLLRTRGQVHLQIPVLEVVADMLPVHLHQLMDMLEEQVVPVLS